MNFIKNFASKIFGTGTCGHLAVDDTGSFTTEVMNPSVHGVCITCCNEDGGSSSEEALDDPEPVLVA